MPASLPIPAALSNGPFTHQDALRCEVSEKVLRGRRFRRLHPRVWVLASYKMSDLDWIRAAELAMPDEARASHLTDCADLVSTTAPSRPCISPSRANSTSHWTASSCTEPR